MTNVALKWNLEGDKLAYLRFNTSLVDTMTLSYGLNRTYLSTLSFPYPKPGGMNSLVTIHVYDVLTNSSQELSIPDNKLPLPLRILNGFEWMGPNLLVRITDRIQSRSHLWHISLASGRSSLILVKKSVNGWIANVSHKS